MKNLLWLLSILFVAGFSGCGGGENKQPGNPAQEIGDRVRQINEREAALNKRGKFVKTPDIETLKSRLEIIIDYFCQQTVENRANSRIITLDSPERFYLSDGLAFQLNRLKPRLSLGYFLRIDTVREPAPGPHGYDEAAFEVFIEVNGSDVLVIELSYETMYDKFHQQAIRLPGQE